MANPESLTEKWLETIEQSLSKGNLQEKILALDFLSSQSSLDLGFAKKVMPTILECVVHPDTQIRYFARKARNHFYDSYPEIDSGAPSPQPFKLDLKDGKPLSAQEILLHKVRLGSRYVVFDALDRLTESGDPTLATPLINYLKQEKDEYKISFLVKRLQRIDDSRIPKVIESYLEHEDPRIVANALEALCDYNDSALAEKLSEFVTSQDNRIRANALLGLYKYEPKLTEKHIEEMVKSNNIALQDSAVFLLKNLRPTNLGPMLEILQHSRFATVRLKTLDIAPPDTSEMQPEPAKLSQWEPHNPNRDLGVMTAMIGIGIFMLFLADDNHKSLLSILFLGVAVLTIIMPEKARTSIQKTALSIGFVSSLAWGNTRLMVLPALMGIWLTWTNKADKSNNQEKNQNYPLAIMFAWFFTIGAIIVSQLVQGRMSSILNLSAQIATSKSNIPKEWLDIVVRQGRFEIMLFALVSILTIGIIKFNDCFPPKNKNTNPRKRFLIAVLACLLIVAVFNLSHVFGISVQLRINSMKDAFELFTKIINL